MTTKAPRAALALLLGGSMVIGVPGVALAAAAEGGPDHLLVRGAAPESCVAFLASSPPLGTPVDSIVAVVEPHRGVADASPVGCPLARVPTGSADPTGFQRSLAAYPVLDEQLREAAAGRPSLYSIPVPTIDRPQFPGRPAASTSVPLSPGRGR